MGDVFVLGTGVLNELYTRIVKLLKNFRSHPDILDFSNKEFYNSELEACGDPMLTRMFENSETLPKKKFPIAFHGIVGRDQRGEESPSFFNIDEATLVKMYYKSLIDNRNPKTRSILFFSCCFH